MTKLTLNSINIKQKRYRHAYTQFIKFFIKSDMLMHALKITNSHSTKYLAHVHTVRIFY